MPRKGTGRQDELIGSGEGVAVGQRGWGVGEGKESHQKLTQLPFCGVGGSWVSDEYGDKTFCAVLCIPGLVAEHHHHTTPPLFRRSELDAGCILWHLAPQFIATHDSELEVTLAWSNVERYQEAGCRIWSRNTARVRKKFMRIYKLFLSLIGF